MAEQTVIGKIGITPKGEYNAETVYDILDAVSNNGNSYVSRQVNNSQPLENIESWMLFAEKGVKGDTFTYDDLTTEEKEQLKGDVIAYNSLTDADKNDLAGRVPLDGEVLAGSQKGVKGNVVFEQVKSPLLNFGFDYVTPEFDFVPKTDDLYQVGFSLNQLGKIVSNPTFRVSKDFIFLKQGNYNTDLNLPDGVYLIVYDARHNITATYTNKSGNWSFSVPENSYIKFPARNSIFLTTYIRLDTTGNYIHFNSSNSTLVDKDFLNKSQLQNELILNNINDNGNFVGVFRWIYGANVVDGSIASGNLIFTGKGDLSSNLNSVYRNFTALTSGSIALVSIVAKSSNEATLYFGRGANIGQIKEVKLTEEFARYTGIFDFNENRIKLAGSNGGNIEIKDIIVLNLSNDLGLHQIKNINYFDSILNATDYFEASKIIENKLLRYATEKEIELLQLKASIETVDFTVNQNINARIKELYLLENYDNLVLRRLYVESNRIRVFFAIKGGAPNEFINLTAYGNIDTTVYGKVLTLYKTGVSEVLGYVILEYYNNVDFLLDSPINLNANCNKIDKSPTIKELLNRTENLINLSDSIFAFSSEQNVLKEFLNSKIKPRFFNTGFGGCRMSWRTSDGSHNYDKFSGVSIADAIATQDFSQQLAASVIIGSSFNFRLADLMSVDFNKPTTIFLNYINNDITGDTVIGDLWDHTKNLSDFNKTTFLGAMNYVIKRISTAYPHVKWVVFGEEWRLKSDKFGVDVPPYAFVNAINIAGTTYSDKMEENAKRLGLSFVDFIKDGIQNPYNNSIYFQDASHLGYKGFVYLSDKLKSVYEGLKK